MVSHCNLFVFLLSFWQIYSELFCIITNRIMLKIKIFSLNPCWLLHNIWHWALAKSSLYNVLNILASRMLLQVFALQRYLPNHVCILSIGISDDEKNSNSVYGLPHSSTQVIMEKKTLFFSVGFINLRHTHSLRCKSLKF